MSAAQAVTAPPRPQAATYGRSKAFDIGNHHDASDSSISSPAQAHRDLFDSSSPLMRSPAGRARHEAACDTSYTTVGDDDDDDEGSRKGLPAAKSRSRVVTASDDEDEERDDISIASPRRIAVDDDEDDDDQLADADNNDDDDDDDAIARMRKRLGLKDPESSDLSSAPVTTDAEPNSSSVARGGRKGNVARTSSDGDDEVEDDDDFGLGAGKSRPVLGGFASRMKARGGAKARVVRDEEDGGTDSDEQAGASTKRLRRVTASDISEAEDSSDDRLPSPPQPTHEINRVAREAQSAAQRAERLRQMAAKRRVETAVSEDEIESDREMDADPVADDGEIMSILTSFQKVDAARKDSAVSAPTREKKKKRQRGEHEGHSKGGKMKSLNKKELEEMERMTARIQREAAVKRAKAAFQKPHERQTFGITNLLASVTAAEASRAKPQAPQVTSTSSSDTPVVSDPIDDVVSGDEAPALSPSPIKSPVPKPRLTFLPPPLNTPSGVAPVTGSSSSRPTTKQPSSTDDDDSQLPDAGQAVQKALERRELAAKQDKLRQLKLKAIEADAKRRAQAAAAQQAKRTAAQLLTETAEADNDDDDLELERPEPPKAQSVFGARSSSVKPSQGVHGLGTSTKPKSPIASRRTKAAPVSIDALRGSLLSKVKAQNLSMRKYSGQPRKSVAADAEESQDTTALLERLQSKARVQAEQAEKGDEDESDGEYVEGQSDGVASDDEGQVAEDDVLPLGSGSEVEDEGGEDNEAQDSQEEDVEDSDKENSQPQLPSSRRATIEEDEDEESRLTLARSGRRRVAIAALSDDDDDDEAPTSQSQRRTPLRALHPESSSTDNFGKSLTDADASSGWSQFFQPTAQPGASAKHGSGGANDTEHAASVPVLGAATQRRNEDALGAFFEPTQQEDSSTDTIAAPGTARRPTTQVRNEDTLGAFFEATQQSSTVEATARPALLGAAGDSAGFSQFFEDATQPGGAITSIRSNAAGSMPPPSAFGSRLSSDKMQTPDAFEAIRHAQNQEAALPPMPTMLPSLAYDAEADMDLEGNSGPTRSSSNRLTTPVKAPLPYLNRQGFYTQTRPSVSDALLDSQTQSQSQSQAWGLYAGEASAADDVEEAQQSERGSQPLVSPPRRRKRLRRASSPVESDGEEREEQASGNEEDEEKSDSEGSVLDDERGSRTPSPVKEPSRPRNAFDVLQRSAANAQIQPAGHSTKKRAKSNFVEGEAEESEDEDAGPAKRKGRGGLGGVYSDSEGSAGDEDSDEEDDGQDLEGLVDDEREADEANKDVLARERYLQDVDAQDAADEALHQKAIAGKLRNRKRGRGAEAGDLGNLLEEDFEDEDLMRRAMNPRAGLPQKRRLQGGDGMDALAANAASEAFLREYAETHKNGEDPEAYSFLGGVDDGDEDEDEDDDQDEERQGRSRAEHDGKERVTAEQLRRELRERRRAKKMRLDDDDDDDEDGQRGANETNKDDAGSDDDDEDDMVGVPGHFVDRIQQARKSKERQVKGNHAVAPKRATTTYGRAPQSTDRSAPDAFDDMEDDEDDAADAMDQLVMHADRAKRSVNEAERQRLAKIAADFGSSDSRGSAHARKRGGAGASITSFKAGDGAGKSMSTSSSASSLNMSTVSAGGTSTGLSRAKSGSTASGPWGAAPAGRRRLVGASASESRLAGLSSVMARQSQFSETQ